MANDSTASFQWINCSDYKPVSDQIHQIFNVILSGSYAVILTKNGCSDTSSCYEVITSGVSQSYSRPELTIYPNPSNGKFQISISNSKYNENFKLVIYNIQGKQIFQNTTNSASVIDLNNQPKGIYFIKVLFGQFILNKVISIQ